MIEVEIELDGREVEVDCPLCDEDGNFDQELRYEPVSEQYIFVNSVSDKEIEKANCPICGGSGTITREATGTIYEEVDIEPMRDESRS